MTTMYVVEQTDGCGSPPCGYEVKRIGAADTESNLDGYLPSDLLRMSAMSELLSAASRVSPSLEPMSGAALGQPTGGGTATRITFDDDAAGYGWYIDATPLSNDEYVRTADPNAWKAKPKCSNRDERRKDSPVR